jgi:phosphate transport system protein
MTEFGKRQGYAEGQRPSQAEQMRKGSDKPLPVARHQKHPEGQQQRQGVTQQTGAITSEPGPGTIEKRIRPPQRNTEEQVISLLALQQPMARDLRFITMSMKIANDLERVGDHAENIADAVKYMISAPPFPVLPEVEEMVRLATDMLADSLDAFVRADAASAREVLKRDDRVDELHDNNFRILLTHMMEDPRRITAGMDLLLISGNVERIADLATNICEEVIFLVEGHSIKHSTHGRSAAG